MSKFTQSVESTIKFDGDEVSFTLRRMQNKHMLKLAPTAVSLPDENRVARTVRLVDEAKEVLKECVTNFRGLKDSQGRDIPFDTVLEESYFLALLDGMLGRLWDISILKEVDAKKSSETPPDASSGDNANQGLLPAS